jgi:nucleoside-diphosphate kinase
VVEGESAVSVVRATMGATNPADAAPGTIRGDLALAMPDNLVHGSDSQESAAREIALWFSDDELV